jgi:hypothetical protein
MRPDFTGKGTLARPSQDPPGPFGLGHGSSGACLANDYVPPGATLSPLTGTGISARTTSNHCVFTWANAPALASGAAKTFNYSTNSQSFSAASNIQVSDPQCF